MDRVAQTSEYLLPIGERVYRTFYDPEPKSGFERHTLELYGHPFLKDQEEFDIEAMRNVFPANLPDSFCMMVFQPQLPYPEIDCVFLHKSGPQCVLKASIKHNYSEWMYPTNLHHFYRILRVQLQSNVRGCRGVEISSDEYGVSAWTEVDIDPSVDLRRSILSISSSVSATFRESLLQTVHEAIPPENKSAQRTDLKPDERGFKWWLRYVIVPITVVVLTGVITTIIRGAL